MSVPFMQLYVADYLGDTRHLTTEQHGAYLLLLMTMWRAGGSLPDDDRKLARLVGCTGSRWAKIRAEVMEFFVSSEGSITNPRLTLELEKASEKAIKRAEVGSRGGKAKALKYNEARLPKASVLLWHSSEPEPDIQANACITRARLFDEAFGAYPETGRSVSSLPAARAAWDAACSHTQPERLLASVKAYAADPGLKKRDFGAPKFERWLSEERWRSFGEPKGANGSSLSPESLARLEAIRNKRSQ